MRRLCLTVAIERDAGSAGMGPAEERWARRTGRKLPGDSAAAATTAETNECGSGGIAEQLCGAGRAASDTVSGSSCVCKRRR